MIYEKKNVTNINIYQNTFNWTSSNDDAIDKDENLLFE